MKGIILAGGNGTRLYPATCGVSKQLIPVYDKPMIYYPLSVLMLSDIKEIAIITTPHDQALFQRLLQDGQQWGMQFEYITQLRPDGLAQAFILAEDFLNGESACLVLGDNIHYGHGLPELLHHAKNNIQKNKAGACIFGYYVSNPQQYGVVEFDSDGKARSIEEKPENPKSHYAVTGLYYYNNKVVDYAKQIKPSARGELEISALNEIYLQENALNVEIMGRGFAWLDTGTHDSMLEASHFIATVEKRQGLKIGCPEEIAFQKGWIDQRQLIGLAQPLKKTAYGKYLLGLVSCR